VKGEMISYRASFSDSKALDDLTKIYGFSRSEMIRFLVRRELKDHEILSSKGERDPILLASQLRIGGL